MIMYYVEVSGKTYTVKEKLKRLGLRWDSDRKVWKGMVNEYELYELRKLEDKFPIEVMYDEDEVFDKGDRYTNTTWVYCWECGRPIPPGQATKDNGKWYCGC